MSPFQILSIGEAMVELSQVEGGETWKLGIAGDTLNTAWYLRKLLPATHQVSYFTRTGTGEFSRQMMAFLQAESIGTQHVSEDPDKEIGLYSISLNAGERSFSYWRSDSAAKRLADDPGLLTEALSKTNLAYFSGITLAILPPEGRAHLLEALAQAQQKGTKLVFDPNLRPKLWPSIAQMCTTTEQAAAHCDLILPSYDDEQTYFNDKDSLATIARYRACGAGQVIVKAGGGPIRYAGDEGEGLIDDLPLETPVDTTSAGDSFNAGYMAAMLGGAAPDVAIRAGHDLSRQVIRHRGALVREAVAFVKGTA